GSPVEIHLDRPSSGHRPVRQIHPLVNTGEVKRNAMPRACGSRESFEMLVEPRHFIVQTIAQRSPLNASLLLARQIATIRSRQIMVPRPNEKPLAFARELSRGGTSHAFEELRRPPT